MKLKCVIVEDEPMARKLLEQYIAKTPTLELLASLSSPLAALEFLREQHTDLLFLDVQMPEITGIGLLKILQNKPAVILTTAYSEYAIEGYELDVTDYLLKPITFERFLQSVTKVSARLAERGGQTSGEASTPATSVSEDYFFVKDGNQSVRVNYKDIQYIEGMKDYVRIHTPQRKIMTLQSLKHLDTNLPADDFIRVHHSYIVGINWLEAFQRDEVTVAGATLPVSDTYRNGLREFIARKALK